MDKRSLPCSRGAVEFVVVDSAERRGYLETWFAGLSRVVAISASGSIVEGLR